MKYETANYGYPIDTSSTDDKAKDIMDKLNKNKESLTDLEKEIKKFIEEYMSLSVKINSFFKER